MVNNNKILEAALAYAKRGFSVFPCDPCVNKYAKKPLVKWGGDAATTDEKVIRGWWSKWPRALIGLPMGKSCGLFVLDIDMGISAEDGQQKTGDLTIAALEAEHGKLPATRTARTQSGGIHKFFNYPKDFDISNSAGKIGKNLDIRGTGGYVIAPPSVNIQGGRYFWSPESSESAPVADAPDWLLNLLRKHDAPTRPQADPATFTPRTDGGFHPAVQKALDDELGALATAPEGTRNSTLNHTALKIGHFVGGCEIIRFEAENLIREAALACGLPDAEISATMKSGLDAGILNPINYTNAPKLTKKQPAIPHFDAQPPALTLDDLDARCGDIPADDEDIPIDIEDNIYTYGQQDAGKDMKDDKPAQNEVKKAAGDVPADEKAAHPGELETRETPEGSKQAQDDLTYTDPQRSSQGRQAGNTTAARHNTDNTDNTVISVRTENDSIDYEPIEENCKNYANICLPSPVPLDVFHPAIQDVIRNAAEAINTPLEVPTACYLGWLAILLVGSRALRVSESQEVYGNMWVALVGSSGVGKSPTQELFFKSIRDIEHRYAQDFETEKRDYAVAKPDDENPAEIPKKQLYSDDITLEALNNALYDNPRGCSLMVDEMSGLVANHGRYTNGQVAAFQGRMLTCYNGGSWKTDRIGKNRTKYIRKAVLSLFGGIQPELLKETYDPSIDNVSGYLPRHIVIVAIRKKPATYTDVVFTSESKETLRIIAECIAKWDVKTETDPETGYTTQHTPAIPLLQQAMQVYIDFHNEIATQGFFSDTESITQKLKDKCLKLCLALHATDAAFNGTSEFKPVAAECMRRAVKLAKWLYEHDKYYKALINGEKMRKDAPIDRVIVVALLQNKQAILDMGSVVSIDEIRAFVNPQSDISNIDGRIIGNACKRLGLFGVRKKTQRAWLIPADRWLTLESNGIVGIDGISPTAATVPSLTTLYRPKKVVTFSPDAEPADQMPEPSPAAPEQTPTQPGDEDDGIII